MKGTQLLIGADGLIGAALASYLRRHRRKFLVTTRRPDKVGPGTLFLDLNAVDGFRIPDGIVHATILAAAVGYENCELNPIAASINSEKIPLLITKLLRMGISVNFISSSSVFGGKRWMPNEGDKPHPVIAYAEQKCRAEECILASADHLGALNKLVITRPTKILAPWTPPLSDWRQKWKQNLVARPFSDFFVSPLSLDYVVSAINIINESSEAGIFHLSGSENISYAGLAAIIASGLGLPESLVEPISSEQAGIKLFYAPPMPGLGMARTTSLLGLKPFLPGSFSHYLKGCR